MDLKKFFTTLALLGILFRAMPQKDTARYLPEVEVVGQRINTLVIGATLEKVDTLALRTFSSKSVADVLAAHAAVSIRSYGPGGLSAASVRGSNTAHTAVVWNDINIASPMNGSMNLATLPAFMVHDLSVQYGGSGVLYGSGAVTGIIHIGGGSLLSQPNSVGVYGSLGSFGDRSVGASAKWGTPQMASSLKVFTQSARNDFSYKNTARFGYPIEKQTNAEAAQWGILQENTWKTSKKSFLKTGIWYQAYEKELQTLMTDTKPSQASQEDDNLFVCVHWKYVDSLFSFSVKEAYLFNQTVYDNPLPPTEHARSYAQSAISELEGKYSITPHQLIDLNLNYTREAGFSDDYAGEPVRNRFALALSYRLSAFSGRLRAVAGARAEWLKEQASPLVYSVGADYQLSKIVTLLGNFSRTYRIPTLNDLYWKNGMYTRGNPDLTPESGWSSQLGVKEHFDGRFTVDFSQTGFYNLIRDQIVWFPNAANVWMPDNKKIGRSYGFEGRINLGTTYRKNNLGLDAAYTYTRAQVADEERLLADAGQLIYIPQHQANVSLRWMFRNVSAYYTHNFYSKRYYDDVNSLEAYQTGNFTLNYKKRIRSVELTTSFCVANIAGTPYQVITWYAMPGRNYKLSLQCNFYPQKRNSKN